ncbi:phage integrase family protein [Azospirillum brasilense]|uniref:Phage integrase family protein n=1 Tax=Azospirillum brasilense TaxID=192 RepID=A0A560BN82_AZOBR|nr:tyrosine-type recombinase/integrase [Azospirillum brasilense]MBK3732922.1 tyrosine-type recombinase/integrase [Azospirillum brasilense]TWA73979.1 phage integrase family protein [Azospirillum brasilense]
MGIDMAKIPLELPRFVIAKNRGGTWAFYFQVPKRLQPEGWPSGALRLRDERGGAITDPVAAVARGRELNAQLDRARSQVSAGPVEGTLPWLIADYQKSDKYKKKAEATRYQYDLLAKQMIAWSKAKQHPQIKQMTTPAVLKFLSQYDDRPTLRARMAAFGSILWNFGRRRGAATDNVWTDLGLEKDAPEVHIWADVEIAAIVAKADEMSRSSIGTAVLLASETGQRQGDVLDMRRGREWDGATLRRVQNKTGAYVTVPATSLLRDRLAALPKENILLVVAETTRQQWKQQAFSKAFREIANAAGLPHIEFRSLRATCVCRLASAGCSIPEIASITGHTLVSVHHILKHYWRPDSDQAKHAIAKVEAFRRKHSDGVQEHTSLS